MEECINGSVDLYYRVHTLTSQERSSPDKKEIADAKQLW